MAGEKDKVQAVRDYVKTITGFKEVHTECSEDNKGLANSIIGGATKILRQYGKVIVVEDDLYTSRSFLRYMNEMLDKFENDKRVMQVSGYGPHLRKKCNADAYLNGRAQSWTWATWLDRWESVDWNVKDFSELSSSKELQKSFCEHGSDLYGMLKGYMEHSNNSWYVRFTYSMHKQGRYSLTPVKSLVRNDGFDGEGTHCTNYNRYKVDFEMEHYGEFNVPMGLQPDKRLMKDAVFYWSIPMRIYGKIMTKLKW